MRKFVLVVAVGVLIALPKLANAEPDANIRTLMNTPVTLFSQGLDNIRIKLLDVTDRLAKDYVGLIKRTPLASVQFKWDENRIDASIFMYLKPNANDDPKSTCRDVLLRMRSFFAVTNGEQKFPILAQNFKPRGYTLNLIDSAIKNIHKLVRLKSRIFKDEKVVIECEGPLVSKKIFYSK
jgi:hypothetical protein